MKFARILCLLLAAVLLFSGCGKAAPSEETTAEDTTEKATEAATTAESEPEPETGEPEFTHPLTGLSCEKDLTGKRPVSIMVNNIAASLPQVGVSQADILYECLAEGGITRLMAIITDYESIGKIGSVRSARDYYVDFAEGYDCIFVHAGGSDDAYSVLANRRINNIDGVRGPAYLYNGTGTFQRDPERLQKFSYEHTLVIQNGAGIKNAVEYYNYRTETKEDYASPLHFAPWGETVTGEEKAETVSLEMSSYQHVRYEYDADAGVYLRFQYGNMPHMDSATDKQLAFTNVLLLGADWGNIPGDDKGRIWMQTTGSGSGYYITAGTVLPITWEKATHDGVMHYKTADGKELELNRGKTMINMVPSPNMKSIVWE